MATVLSRWTFCATDLQGRRVEGCLLAPSEDLARLRLSKLYSRVHALRAETPSPHWLQRLSLPALRVKTEVLTMATRQLSVMVAAGVPLNRALRFLAEGDDPAVNLSLARVAVAIEEGKCLSRGLQDQPQVFSPTYIALVRAGEQSGNLELALRKLADLLEKVVTMKKRVNSAFAYPAVIALVCSCITALFVFYVMPMMLPMFTSLGVELPWMTQVLIAVTEWARDPRTLVALMSLVLLGGGAGKWVANQSGPHLRYQLDLLCMQIPVLGSLLYGSAVTRVLHTMGTLLEAGVPLSQSLATLQEVAGHAVLRARLEGARQALLNGSGAYQAFKFHETFPEMALQMLKVGEEIGTLPQMALRVALLYEEEVDSLVGNLASLIEPLMMAVMGGIAGFVVLATMLPLVSLVQQF